MIFVHLSAGFAIIKTRRLLCAIMMVSACSAGPLLTVQAAENASTETTVPLDSWLASPALWKTTRDNFPAGREFGFRWVSAAHDAARADNENLRLRDLRVAEVIARFAAPGIPVSAMGSPSTTPTLAGAGSLPLSSVQLSIYNRGDAGDLEPKKFDALVDGSKAALDTLTGAKSLDRGTDNSSAVQSRGLVWTTPASRFLLEWSATAENKVQNIAYRAEFVRLKVTPQRDQPKTALEQMRVASAPLSAAAKSATVRAADLPARVTKNTDGGLLLSGIPMVDQGQKGYCVTAATERVLRYYGVETDQNELAQIANTATSGGTSTEAMVAALKKLASRFRVNVVTEIDLTYQDFLREIDDYNRVARNAPKTAGIALIDTRTQPLSYETVLNQMDGETLRQARTKLNPAYMGRFEREIQGRLSRGIPLLWSVTLGMLPEDKFPVQSKGGHMRLIIGYNPKTREVSYSDTWGLGHELKKMPLADAWTITNGVFTLEPI